MVHQIWFILHYSATHYSRKETNITVSTVKLHNTLRFLCASWEVSNYWILGTGNRIGQFNTGFARRLAPCEGLQIHVSAVRIKCLLFATLCCRNAEILVPFLLKKLQQFLFSRLEIKLKFFWMVTVNCLIKRSWYHLSYQAKLIYIENIVKI